MAGKLVNEGETVAVQKLLQAADMYMGLYSDVAEPGETATLPGGVTPITEATGGGYQRVLLDKDDWTILNDTATGLQETFAFTGPTGAAITGYFISTTSDDTGKLVMVEHFSNGPYDVQTNGDEIKVTPVITAA